MSGKEGPPHRKRTKSETDHHAKDAKDHNPLVDHKGGHHPHGDGQPHGDHHTTGHYRPRAGTLTRRDTAHSTSSKDRHPHHHVSNAHSHKGDQSDKRSVGTAENQVIQEFENTYKLEPDHRFMEGKVKAIILQVLKENINDKMYDPSHMGSKCKLMSEIIKERVKHLDLKRFKIISMVTIGQEADQSMLMCSRSLWDHRFDNYACVELKHGNIFAIGIVFAVYAE
ncbi:hypothetical protein CHS0354_042194 [Potamilus streckersoni]|uniref:Uncharacterized protein n=1 Tax=Potamilus streckersoni TaxID=2493646 RepID=A0AAE0TQV8_9BIVA|nr:hypothetical protein CHS0354_042194 [Potamilus streckersoni]